MACAPRTAPPEPPESSHEPPHAGAEAASGASATPGEGAAAVPPDEPGTVRTGDVPGEADSVVPSAEGSAGPAADDGSSDEALDPFATFDRDALDQRALWYERWPAMTESWDEGGLDCAPADFRLGAELWEATLGDDRRIVGMLCQPGAYNFGFALFDVRRDGERWSWAPLELPRCADPPTLPQWDVVYLPTWDADAGTLHAFARARGLGDCGQTETWALSDDGFCLSRCAIEHECRERLPPWEPLFVDPTCGGPPVLSP